MKMGSFFRPISADDGASGPRPHIALLDEIHEHKTDKIVEFLRAGTKGRRQALIFMITNSGSNKESVCWHYHEYARQVCDGALEDDSFFGYVCALDEGDDPFKDEECWDKVNPSLGVTIPRKYLQEQVREARGMPSKEATVRRLNFCQWTDAHHPWISFDRWVDAKDEEELTPYGKPAIYEGRRCWGGLDLGSTQDLTAFALTFEPNDNPESEWFDPYWRMKVWFWLPGDPLAEKTEQDRVPYLAWRDKGYLQTTEGRAVNRRAIIQQIMGLSAKFDIRSIAYDRWRIEDLMTMIEDEGYTMPPLKGFGQGYASMSPALDAFEIELIEGTLRHDGNPVLTWNANNAVTSEDEAGNRKLAKNKAIGRIDGIVAAVMAQGQAIIEREECIYERRGVRRLWDS
jgi:phage terminase large subunit-like protein